MTTGALGPRGRCHRRAPRPGRPLLGGRHRGRRRRRARRHRRDPDRRGHGARRGGRGALGRLGLRAAAADAARRRDRRRSSATPARWPSRSTCAACINVQFAVKDGQVYVLEANPRASRTVPFVAKATGRAAGHGGLPGHGGPDAGRPAQGGPAAAPTSIGRVPVLDHVSVKEAVLPFDRFPGVDTLLGPEMRSTGEVMGVDITFGLAFAKSQMAAGTRLPDSGTVFLSLADRDKPAGLEVARAFSALGFSLAATLGTAGYLRSEGLVGRHAGGQGGGGGRGLRRGRAHRPGQGAAGREHAARPRPAGRRPAHPHRLGGPQGALPHHAGRGPGRGGGHRRRAVAPARRCARSRTCTRLPGATSQ